MDTRVEPRHLGGVSAPTLDPASGRLTRDGEVATLRPKTLAVLLLLMERQGAVVSPDVLRDAVWGRRYGNDNGPKQCIRELRTILADDTVPRRFIETIGLYGYRYLGGIDIAGESTPREGPPRNAKRDKGRSVFVSRGGELDRLSSAVHEAVAGECTIVLVSGETGAGKTALIDQFLSGHHARSDIWIARTHCVPNPGPREPYGPLLELVSSLAEAPVGRVLTKFIRECAPTLFGQLPNVFGTMETDRGEARRAGIAPTRLLRELIEVFDNLGRRRPGILVIEDIHWADTSTLAWISACALQRKTSRLLVVCTCRSDELVSDNRPLMETVHELHRSPAFHDIRLGGLDVDAMRAYLDGRFPGHAFPMSLAPQLARRTEGHALFVVSLIETWLAEGLLREEGGKWIVKGSIAELMRTIPARANEVIDFQISRLTQTEFDILTAGSIAGPEFAVAAISDGRFDEETIERHCDNLARRRLFVHRSGASSWPDGTAAANYAFIHALHHEAIYNRTPTAVRRGWHQRIGDRLEQAYRARAGEIAAVLATHFERAGNIPRAVLHHRRAAETALKRGAAREAANRLRHAVQLLHMLADSDARKRDELQLQTQLGAALMMAEGFGSPSVAAAYGRAEVISSELAESALVPTLCGLWNYHLTRADFRSAQPMVERLEVLASHPETDRVHALYAHNAAGTTHWLMGRPAQAERHVDTVLGSYDVGRDSDQAASFGEDPGIVGNMYGAIVRQLRGVPDAAERHFEQGMEIARTLQQPFGMAQMLWSGALIARERNDVKLTLERARQLIDCCRDNDVAFWLSGGYVFEGWANVAASGTAAGLVRIRDGIERWIAEDTRLTLPFSLALLSDACLQLGRTREARQALDDAHRHMQESGERWYAAEIYRLSGLAERRRGDPAAVDRAASEIRRAAQTAKSQQALSLEGRAIASLYELTG